MEKLTSKKIEKWSKKDLIANIFVYVLNTIFIFALMTASAYLNYLGDGNGEGFVAYVTDFRRPLHLGILVIIVISAMALYFAFDDRNFLRNANNSEMIFLIIEFSLAINYVLGKYVNVYLRPLPLCALLVLFLANRRSAIIVNVVFCILVFLMDSFTESGIKFSEYSSLVIGFSAGFIGIYLTNKVYSRLVLLMRSLVLGVPALICMLLSLVEHGMDNFLAPLVSALCSGLLSVMLFIIILPFFEALFHRVSPFRLAELTDHKSYLIRKLITEAPGTFNHSMVVSNIAEACAIAIGEDSLLARTCAYYHDIGKLRRPEYFTENQFDGVNPHDDLTPELSTNIIKAHTTDGYKLILKQGLPKVIADSCLEHHGTMPILYFYDKAKKFTDGDVDIAQYSYSGPKPQSKISAIIMIADGCEAATRTLADRSRENVLKVVRKIVEDRRALGQFDECEITLKELNIIINTVADSLPGVYHMRVEYPKTDIVTGTDKTIVETGDGAEKETTKN